MLKTLRVKSLFQSFYKNNSCIMDKPMANEVKRFKKIPIYVVEEHNEALQFIYAAIGGKKLPLEGTTLVHLDAHPDMLIDRKLKGSEARSGRQLLPLLQIENWIVPAAAAGHVARVVWLRPPWAKQFTDGTRTIHVGDHPETGLLRVNCKEPYYLSDALYSPQLLNTKQFLYTVAELSQNFSKEKIEELAHNLEISEPYVLDIDLDFFSTGNPFLDLFEEIKLYDRLESIFGFDIPLDDNEKTIENFCILRESQLQELESLFEHLEKYDNLEEYTGPKSNLFEKVTSLVDIVKIEAKRLGVKPDWWAIFAGGCTRDQGGLPYHISTEEDMKEMITKSFKLFLKYLPTPTLITVARSTEDEYCPSHQVEFIQTLVLDILKEVYNNTDKPFLHYLSSK